MTQFIDAHAHLEILNDLKIVLLRAKETGVAKIVTCGSSLEWSRKCVELAEDGNNLVEIFACCGIHPQDGKTEVGRLGSGYIEHLKTLIESSDRVVAIGECGLDYLDGTGSEERAFQKELFRSQVELAQEQKLPLVVHCRNAWVDIFDPLTMNHSQLTTRGMFHSWTGSLADAKRAVALGFYISFSGIVTFRNAGEIVDVAKWVPSDRMLVETDTPFLSPIPLRGKPNEPKNVKITAQFIANLRSESIEKIAETTTRNAKKLFGI